MNAQDLTMSVGGVELPARSGLGLKTQHFQDVLDARPNVGFFEVHAENFMTPGGPFHHYLTRVRELYPLSIHGVGLSIGADGPLDAEHLARLANLLDRYQPQMFSEHLAWSTHSNVFLNDLLPLPYTRETLLRVCEHIDQVQTTLRRRMLLENPATYVEFSSSAYSETDFIGEVLKRTGCGLLLDVNNAYVSCVNHHRDANAYIRALPLSRAEEIHLAGFARDQDAAGDPLLIDHHGSPIDAAVWTLYEHAIDAIGPVATLIERDNNVPPLATLLQETQSADAVLHAAPAPYRARA